jgi:biotin operon repressor
VQTASETQPAAGATPPRVRDELAWELVRDEWELLLAIGSGPTTVAQAAGNLGLEPARVDKRIDRLRDHGLIAATPHGYQLVPAFYERREGMSSYLRDLVLRRVQAGTAAPVAGRARCGLGSAEDIARIIASAESAVLPEVVALANRPESPRSERFSVFLACASTLEGAEARAAFSREASFRDRLLAVLRAAATARSLNPETRSAYLWVAEMRTDPEVAAAIGDLLERFTDGLETAPDPSSEGCIAFAILPAALHPQRQSES